MAAGAAAVHVVSPSGLDRALNTHLFSGHVPSSRFLAKGLIRVSRFLRYVRAEPTSGLAGCGKTLERSRILGVSGHWSGLRYLPEREICAFSSPALRKSCRRAGFGQTPGVATPRHPAAWAAGSDRRPRLTA
jgi:hypothetical protein